MRHFSWFSNTVPKHQAFNEVVTIHHVFAAFLSSSISYLLPRRINPVGQFNGWHTISPFSVQVHLLSHLLSLNASPGSCWMPLSSVHVTFSGIRKIAYVGNWFLAKKCFWKMLTLVKLILSGFREYVQVQYIQAAGMCSTLLSLNATLEKTGR